jgi:hypothetical protein
MKEVRLGEEQSKEQSEERRLERRLERNDSKSIILPSYANNTILLVASLLTSPLILTHFAIHSAHCRLVTTRMDSWKVSNTLGR